MGVCACVLVRVRVLFSSVLCLSMVFIQNCFFFKSIVEKNTINFVSVSGGIVLGSWLQHSLAV